ncbi:hypothetical protein KNV00_gp041 [Streptomyces phage Bmoc]|uniref:Uncharacterized protein n=1 Tax=Streptomyces phage Bmoc TaxID=2725629 RepID=A0A6M3T0Q3_9CAUD|nr:hypothetical protein KNV00_gp014 [Streptomyces phage Bmoc]YP_010107629.1 hypothetical protein KNV00_gp041 [Streptomyces phage Bmoc]QJD50764.1 hypothetical protein SEA_BMOC_14 [Streptomyces phage Bmoc]QJD50978.1 hypothetical protein SEA_BMOC_270 [Streptomyces phage Bmoc]
MFGVRVRVYYAMRDKFIEILVKDTTPDSMNTAWNLAVDTGELLFNLTDQNGNRIAIHTKNVDMFVAMPWNGV